MFWPEAPWNLLRISFQHWLMQSIWQEMYVEQNSRSWLVKGLDSSRALSDRFEARVFGEMRWATGFLIAILIEIQMLSCRWLVPLGYRSCRNASVLNQRHLSFLVGDEPEQFKNPWKSLKSFQNLDKVHDALSHWLKVFRAGFGG